MKQKTGKPISFRPYQDVRERLDIASDAGLDLSKVINKVLRGELDDYLREMLLEQDASANKLREALAQPVN